MRVLVACVLGLAGGFFAGVILSQLIGIAGFLLFQQAVGIKFLPLYTAAAGAVVGPLLAGRGASWKGRFFR